MYDSKLDRRKNQYGEKVPEFLGQINNILYIFLEEIDVFLTVLPVLEAQPSQRKKVQHNGGILHPSGHTAYTTFMMKNGVQQRQKMPNTRPSTVVAFFSLSIWRAFFCLFRRFSRLMAATIRPAFLALGVRTGLLDILGGSSSGESELLLEPGSANWQAEGPELLPVLIAVPLVVFFPYE